MPHPSRRFITTVVAIAATLGFVGVSAALEGEDPTLGETEVSCPDPTDSATDEGTATDDGATDDGTATDDGATDDSATDDSATDDSATDGVAGDGTEGSEDCEEPSTDTDGVTDDGTDGTTEVDEVPDDSAAPETDAVDNHGAAVSQAAHDCPPGPDHGPCVRDVAHSDVGKKDKHDSLEDESVDAGDGEDEDASEVEADDEGAEVPAKGHGGGKAKHGR